MDMPRWATPSPRLTQTGALATLWGRGSSCLVWLQCRHNRPPQLFCLGRAQHPCPVLTGTSQLEPLHHRIETSFHVPEDCHAAQRGPRCPLRTKLAQQAMRIGLVMRPDELADLMPSTLSHLPSQPCRSDVIDALHPHQRQEVITGYQEFSQASTASQMQLSCA